MELSMVEISEVLAQWAEECRMEARDLLFTFRDNVLTIYIDRPGILIGKAGNTVQRYKQYLKEKVDYHNDLIEKLNKREGVSYKLDKVPYVKLNIIEVDRPTNWLHYDPMSEGF